MEEMILIPRLFLWIYFIFGGLVFLCLYFFVSDLLKPKVYDVPGWLLVKVMKKEED
ncbi:MAG: hypothetical protein ACLFPF_10905 [Halanaerobiales bacterium]